MILSWVPQFQAGWRSRLASAVCLTLSAAGPAGLKGQAPMTIEGRVLRSGAGTPLPVPGLRVVAHEVGQVRQAPVDSLASDREGRFRFRLTPDTGSVLLMSARYAGIEYFSDPVSAGAGGQSRVEGVDIIVSDTSSVAPLEVASRHVVIGRPGEDGLRPVLEIVVLRNQGGLTRVGGGTPATTWSGLLPAGALQFSVGEGAYAPETLARRGDSVALSAPVAPGEKQLLYSYGLPGSSPSLRFPVADSIAELTFLLEEPGRAVRGGRLVLADTQVIEGRSFQRWSGAAGSGDEIEIRLAGAGPTRWGLALLVGAMTLLLTSAAIMALRRRPRREVGSAPDFIGEIARLDAQYAGREGEVPPAEWRRYREERARLKAELQGRLAGRESAP